MSTTIVIAPETRIGAYLVERKLGAGGMGAVYLSRRASDGARVALKLMHDDVPEKLEARRRFLREARATAALDHDNVIKIHETFEHDGRPVIAMEYLEGVALTQLIERRGKLAVRDAAQIFLRIVSAVGSAHALGLVHRDLKPDNIQVLEREPFVKVLDFGIAKMRKGYALEASSELTRTGMLVGTPYYMSPEQAFGDKTIDHRADMWSLGLMLYEALSGALPTRAATLHEVFTILMTHDFPRLDRVDPAIGADLATVVQRMLSRDRAHRPTDLREVFAVLGAHAGEIEAEPTSFDAAIEPISFADGDPDERARAAVADQPRAAAPPSAPAQPLQLTPRSLRLADGRQTPEGTMILADESATTTAQPLPAAPPPAMPGSAAARRDREGAHLDASIHLPRRSGAWMWVAAVLIVLGCMAVLATRFI